MISQPRRSAFAILRQIEFEGAFSDDALNSRAVNRLEPRDRNLTTEIVYGTLRWQLLLDHVLSKVATRPWDEVDPEIRIILRMSLHQMCHMDRIPDHAILDDAVELTKSESRPTGAAGFVNGVLRTLSRNRPWQRTEFTSQIPPWARVSIPRWLWERWLARFGEPRAAAYAMSLNQAPRHSFRIRDGESVPQFPQRAAISPSDVVPGCFVGESLQLPGVSMQDEASQLIPHLFGPISGARIWDACAAPGGKSAILRERCGPRGIVVSSDLRLGRVRRLRQALKGQSAQPYSLVADATRPAPFTGSFDAVLADVPCSGLGTLRRNPEIRWRFRTDRLSSLRQTQLSIVRAVAAAVRNGGLLLYSTCSTEPEENEQVVDAFLDSHHDFRLIRPAFPPGIDAWTDEHGYVRTFPSTRLWDSFFSALMVRFS